MSKTDITLLVTVGVLLLLVVGVSLFGIRPLFGRLTGLQAEREQTEKELAELEARSETLGKLAKNEAEVRELGRRALLYLPTSITSSPFVMDVAAIAGASGTNVPSMNFQDADPKKGPGGNVAEYPITLSADGNFDQLKTFLRSLEENLRFAAFSSVSISLLPESLSLQLTGAIYSKPEEENPKDKSLSIDDSMKELLIGRKIFGAAVEAGGPGRPDPFVPF